MESREREWAAKGHLELAYTSISPQRTPALTKQTTLSKQHATCIKKTQHLESMLCARSFKSTVRLFWPHDCRDFWHVPPNPGRSLLSYPSRSRSRMRVKFSGYNFSSFLICPDILFMLKTTQSKLKHFNIADTLNLRLFSYQSTAQTVQKRPSLTFVTSRRKDAMRNAHIQLELTKPPHRESRGEWK